MLQPLRYSRAKLAATALIFTMATGFCVILFAHPSFQISGPFSGIASGNIGHYMVLPLLILSLSTSSVRAAIMAFGSLEAVAADHRGMRITTAWRTHVIDWSDLQDIRLTATKVRDRTLYAFKFHRRSAGTVSLPLGALAMPEQEYRAAFDGLLLAKQRAAFPPTGRSDRDQQFSSADMNTHAPRRTFGRKRN